MSRTPLSEYNWGLRQQKLDQERAYRDTMDRVTAAPGRTDGMHFGTGTVVAGVVIAFVLWFPLQFVGLNPLWCVPAGGLGIVVAGFLTNRQTVEREPRRGARIPSPIRFFTFLGAIVCAGLGVWFAVSEGDIPLVRAGLTFGGIGAVLGFIIGGLVRMRRGMKSRRTA